MDKEALTVFNSIFSTGSAFVYRCANDENFTMKFMAGQVEKLCGCPKSDILGNAKVSYAGLTHADDIDRVFADVDAAIEAKANWDVAYRLSQPDGSEAWVRERGNAVYDDNGEMVYLEGLVVDASTEVNLRKELQETLNRTEEANAEIIDLAENILRSVQKLSILAINAGIEAARAGKAGLGFAYLAREIKALADENNRWASRITDTMAQRKRDEAREAAGQAKAG
ncbi:methyl-accepting chemotaxis protein [Leisingera caerulea]|uniref:histidine kinase n=1 Tax=Leisingera caerulea TaxID=506591 RepID=A0A9Q9LWV4_LEICA|nr:PAS domain-containing protein [Leisingera caerulea]UWQ54140.1 PAS domain-containing protein [Leisingera caerulea]